jgi:hypothetical protein
MTPTTLNSFTRKDLAQMARKEGVLGWHSMRKEQLVRAIIKTANGKGKGKGKQLPVRPTAGTATASKRRLANGSRSRSRSGGGSRTNPRARKRIGQLQAKLDQIRNLASAVSAGARKPEKDRLILMVRDPYWLNACWELSSATIQRARAALGQYWHSSMPVLRLLEVAEDGTATLLREIQIHGGVNNWYVDVQDPPSRFRVEIGYQSDYEGFYRLLASNLVSTPPPGLGDAMDDGWADLAANADRIFAMSGGYASNGDCRELRQLLEERIGRSVGSPMQTRYGAGAGDVSADEFQLAVDAEVVVFGATQWDAHVTLQGEPVQLNPDGTFTVRLHMPERRQVIPVVASSSDGVEQRTISIAVERNTKIMEPVVREMGN